MVTGSVRWYNDSKGLGFITPDSGGEDLFVHYAQINVPTLKEGQKVSFDIARGPKGKQAVNVYPIESVVEAERQVIDAAVAAYRAQCGAPLVDAIQALLAARGEKEN